MHNPKLTNPAGTFHLPGLSLAGVTASIGLLALPAFLMFSPEITVPGIGLSNAHADSKPITAQAKIDSSISLTADSILIDNLRPSGDAPAFKTGSTSALVTTNNPTGYTLYLSDADADTTLTHNTLPNKNIPSLTTNTTISPSDNSAFPTNSWGYSLDNTTYKPIPTSKEQLKKVNQPVSSTDTTNSRTDLTFAVKVDTSLPAGTYVDTIELSAISNYSSAAYEPTDFFLDPTTNTQITTMQQMTTDICASVPTPEPFTADGTINADVPEITLTDSRDNNIYKVRKLADGNCWMVNNLALDATRIANYNSESKTATITPSDSDVTTNISIPAPVLASQTSNSYTISYIANNGSDSTYLYNYHAAAAYPDGTTVETDNAPTTSICPKSWQLPSVSKAEGMLSAYGYGRETHFNNGFNPFKQSPFDYSQATSRFANSWVSDAEPIGTKYSLYYLSDVFNATNARKIALSDSVISTTAYNFVGDGDTKQSGFAIRCLAK